MASTKESVRVLRRRSAEILSRSGGGGSDDSGRANVNAVNEGGVKAKTSTKIADVLAGLPLSKVKIVIGEPISKVIYL